MKLVGYGARLILLYVRAVLMAVGGDPRRREKKKDLCKLREKETIGTMEKALL